MVNTKNNRTIYYICISILVLTILCFELLIIPENINLLNSGEVGIISRINAIMLYLAVAYFASGFLIFEKLVYLKVPNKIGFLLRVISATLFVGYLILLVIYTQGGTSILHDMGILLVSIENRIRVNILDLRKICLLFGAICGIR